MPAPQIPNTKIAQYLLESVREHEEYILGFVSKAWLYKVRILGYGDVEFAADELFEARACEIDEELTNEEYHSDWYQYLATRQAACNYFE